ncbi:unnamed protein product [Absidia cylindrospora]
MIASIKGLKHAPSNFSIEILPQYLTDNGNLICYPGSVFEGLVKLTLAEPIVFQRLKIVFKATERVNYDAMGWEKIRNDDGRLFAVRTTLLGRHMQHSGDTNNNTVLQAGEHIFSFAIELPLVNYPPSIDHHLVGTTFTLVASIERGTGVNGHIFRSTPYLVCFRPALQTRVNKVLPSSLSASSEHVAPLTQRIMAKLSLPSLEYNLFDTIKIPLKLTLTAANDNHFADISLQQLHISLKQTITIVHKTFTRTETTTVSHIDHRISNMLSPPTSPVSSPPTIGSSSMTSPPLPLSSSAASSSSSVSSSSMSSSSSSSSSSTPSIVYQGELAIDSNLLPTVGYSSRYKVDYMLSVSVKTRHGPLSTKKKLFNLAIHFGTLPAGMLPNEAIQVYTEEEVINSTCLLFKPKFLKPLNDPVEFLPAYDELYRPPSYRSMAVAAANATSPPPPRPTRPIPFVPL